MSGLACAEQLLRDDPHPDITILESRRIPGGFARSEFDESGGFYTEHSWRGYAPFYRNFFDSVRLVEGIEDAFSKPLRFHLPKNAGKADAKQLTVRDKLILGFKIARVLSACPERQAELASKNFLDGIKHRLSEGGVDRVLGMLGPGLGLDMFRTSEYHFGKYIAATLEPAYQVSWGEKVDVFTPRDAWVTTSSPTSTSWIDPWVESLRKRGVKFEFEEEVVDIRVEDSGRLVVTVESGTAEKTDEDRRRSISVSPEKRERLVMAVSPFSAKRMLGGLRLTSELRKLWPLTREGPNSQISFRVSWARAIPFPSDTSVMALPDSAYNLTICPQVRFWAEGPHPEVNARMKERGIMSLWTGTACSCTDTLGPLFGKTAVECSIEELKKELVWQILECAGIRNLTGGNLDQSDILDVEIWYEWQKGRPVDLPTPSLPAASDSGKTRRSVRSDTIPADQVLHSTDSKWVTTCETHLHRPLQDTGIFGFVQCGAHTKTTMDLWSMEGAAESGKLASSLVLGGKAPSYIWRHGMPGIAKALGRMDSAVWSAGCPSPPFLIIVAAVVLVALAVLAATRCALRK